MSTRARDRCAADQVRLGDRVHWQDDTYRVIALRGTVITLLPLAGGPPVDALYTAVAGAPGFAVLDPSGQPTVHTCLPSGGLMEATDTERAKAQWWQRHLHELDTGLLPGHDLPRPGYDPAATTLAQRCAAKAAELAAAGIDISPRTLGDKRRRWKRAGENPLAVVRDGRSQRTPQPGGRTDERVIALMREVVARQAGESGGTLGRVYADVLDLVHRRYAKQLADPEEKKRLLVPRSTFYRRLNELGLADQVRAPTRQRTRQASKPRTPYTVSVALRPGELVQIDTAPLKIKAIGDDARVVSAEVTAAIDVASRSCPGIMIVPALSGEGSAGRRIGGRATKAFDLVLLLAQMYAPLAMRPGWDAQAAAAASALPFDALRASDPRFTEAVAARPVIHPRTLVVDQGSPYLSEHFREVCEQLGISLRYARKKTPSDKPVVEAYFRALGDTFSQWVAGWTGRSHETRGRAVERARLYSINQLQALAEEYIALEHQQLPHAGLRSPLYPGQVLSPNEMYAHLVAGCGYRPRPLTVEDNRRLLIPAWVTVTDQGVRIEGRTYHSPEGQLRALEGLPSGIRARSDRWEARYNPYFPETAWLYDHRHGGRWITLEFIYRHLLADPWTHYLWEDIAQAATAQTGRRPDQRTIALAVRERRRRTRTAPAPPDSPPGTFQGAFQLDTDDVEPAGYPHLEPLDPDTLEIYPSLPVPGQGSISDGLLAALESAHPATPVPETGHETDYDALIEGELDTEP